MSTITCNTSRMSEMMSCTDYPPNFPLNYMFCVSSVWSVNVCCNFIELGVVARGFHERRLCMG